MTEPPLLVGRGLTYAAGGRRLVEGADILAEPGTVQVIVGPNGAGKSTLLRLLSGELRPLAGTLAYAGEPAAAIPPWRLATLRAVMPQAARLTFPFAAGEVARIGLDGIGRRLDRRARDAILDEALRRADVAHLADRIYATLSGGEQARVQFARALCQLSAGRTVAPRQVLFLDEPTASLDLRHQSGLLDAAARIAAEGAAVVAILHDLNLAAAYADTLLVMKAGRIVARGAPADIIRDDLLARVFGVPWRVGQVPNANQPFVLPQRRMVSMPHS
jgi:iron complex transport system ATP-binding protein